MSAASAKLTWRQFSILDSAIHDKPLVDWYLRTNRQHPRKLVRLIRRGKLGSLLADAADRLAAMPEPAPSGAEAKWGKLRKWLAERWECHLGRTRDCSDAMDAMIYRELCEVAKVLLKMDALDAGTEKIAIPVEPTALMTTAEIEAELAKFPAMGMFARLVIEGTSERNGSAAYSAEVYQLNTKHQHKSYQFYGAAEAIADALAWTKNNAVSRPTALDHGSGNAGKTK